MALIKCEECGHVMSDKATKCPYCGCPINENETAHKAIKKKTTNTRILLVVSTCVLVIGLVGVGVWWWHTHQTGEANADAVVKITPKFTEAIHKYDVLGEYHEGIACTRNAETQKWGFINTKGKEIIKCQYEWAGYFSDGLAPVQNISGKWGYINKKGKVVVPFIYAYANPFSEGIAIAAKNEGDNTYTKLTFIDSNGKVIDRLTNMNLLGFIEENGELGITSLEVEGFSNGVAWFRSSDMSDVITIDKEGNIVERPKDDVVKGVDYEITEDGIVDNNGKLVASYPESLGYWLSCDIVYDGRSWRSTPNIRNGVILATLVFRSYNWDQNVEIYGYVDLEGNTTFTDDDWAKIEKARKEGGE